MIFQQVESLCWGGCCLLGAIGIQNWSTLSLDTKPGLICLTSYSHSTLGISCHSNFHTTRRAAPGLVFASTMICCVPAPRTVSVWCIADAQ